MLVQLWLQLLVISSLGEMLFCGAAREMLDANTLNSYKPQNVPADCRETNLQGTPRPSLPPRPQHSQRAPQGSDSGSNMTSSSSCAQNKPEVLPQYKPARPGGEGTSKRDTHLRDGRKDEFRATQNNTRSCPLFPKGTRGRKDRREGGREGFSGPGQWGPHGLACDGGGFLLILEVKEWRCNSWKQ